MRDTIVCIDDGEPPLRHDCEQLIVGDRRGRRDIPGVIARCWKLGRVWDGASLEAVWRCEDDLWTCRRRRRQGDDRGG